MKNSKALQALREYRRQVKAGLRPPPKRNPNAPLRRLVNIELSRNFGPDHGKKLILTLHNNGRLELRPERTRRSESVMLDDVYRYAIRCRVNQGQLTKARERKEKKAARLAAQRQARAEKKLYANSET